MKINRHLLFFVFFLDKKGCDNTIVASLGTVQKCIFLNV